MVTIKRCFTAIFMLAAVFAFTSQSYAKFSEPGGQCNLPTGTVYDGNGFRGLVTLTHDGGTGVTVSAVLTEESNCDCTLTLSSIPAGAMTAAEFANATPDDFRGYCTGTPAGFVGCSVPSTNWELVGVGTLDKSGLPNTITFEGRVRILVSP